MLLLGASASCSTGQRISAPPAGGSPVSPVVAGSEALDSGWALETRSPIPLTARAGSTPDLAGDATARDVVASLQSACGAADGALVRAANVFARRLSEGKHAPEPDSIALELRKLGSPYVWPRAWALGGTSQRLASDGVLRLEDWLSSFDDGGERRCGVSWAGHEGRFIVAVVVSGVLAELDPLPVEAPVGHWLSLEATLLVPASEAKVVLLGPSGAPRPVPTTLLGRRIRARFALERRGRFLVQVLADVRGGPRPVLEALVFADAEPPLQPAPDPAPGEEASGVPGDPTWVVLQMLNAARRKERLPPLNRQSALDRVAQGHAEAMRDVGRLGHDIGNGNPTMRAAAAGLILQNAGENVAHAMSLAHAHRSLYASPSHRANMLSPGFDSVGIGVAGDGDGTVWVCQLYAQSSADVQ